MSMNYSEARRYSQRMYGADSDKAAQLAEVETLKVYHPEKATLLHQLQKEALKYGLRLRDLVAEPFSVCVCTSDLKRILARMSVSANNILQSQQVIDDQLGRAIPVSTFGALMETLKQVQHEQLEVF